MSDVDEIAKPEDLMRNMISIHTLGSLCTEQAGGGSMTT